MPFYWTWSSCFFLTKSEWWLVIYWLVCFEKICTFLIALLNLLYYSLCCLMHIFMNVGGPHCYWTNTENANTILGTHKVCLKNSSSVMVVCHSKHTHDLNPRPGKQEQSNRNDPHVWHVNSTHITASQVRPAVSGRLHYCWPSAPTSTTLPSMEIHSNKGVMCLWEEDRYNA